MSNVFKWLVGIFIGVLVVTGICVGVLLAVVDEELVKTQLADVARKQTGGELTIDGQLGWTVFPQLGVSVDQLQFIPRDEEKSLATVGTLRLGVDFLPLLKGQLNVSEITLTGLRLDLVKGADGTGNWEELLIDQGQPAVEAEAPPADTAEGGGMHLAISTLNIADTEVNYSDQQSGETYQLADFSMQSNDVNLDGQSFPVTIGFTVNTPQAALVVDLSTELSGDIEAQQFQLSELQSTIAVTGAATNDQTITTQLAADANIDLKAQQANIENLLIQLADLSMAGNMAITQLSDDPQILAKLQSEPFNPRQLIAQIGMDEPPFSDKKALQHARFEANISANSKTARLENIALELDQTKATGSVAITDLNKQAVRATFAVDQFNLDTYQMVATEDAKAAASGNTPPGQDNNAASQMLLPLETIRALDLSANLKIGTLIASGMTLTAVDMKVAANNGQLNLSKLQAKLYQGAADISASIDAQTDNPRWKINTKVSNVQVGPLLKAANDIDWIAGTFNFNGNLTTRGNDPYALKQNLVGPASFSMSKGVVKGMNLEQAVCQGIALINQRHLDNNWPSDTELNTIDGKLQFGGGKITNKSLTAGLKNADIKGSGDIDMLKSEVDYRLGVRILGQMREVDPACEVNKRYKDVYWPMRCAGNLSDEPKELCGIDEAAMGDIASKMLEQELRDRAGDDIERKAKDEFKRLLDRL